MYRLPRPLKSLVKNLLLHAVLGLDHSQKIRNAETARRSRCSRRCGMRGIVAPSFTSTRCPPPSLLPTASPHPRCAANGRAAPLSQPAHLPLLSVCAAMAFLPASPYGLATPRGSPQRRTQQRRLRVPPPPFPAAAPATTGHVRQPRRRRQAHRRLPPPPRPRDPPPGRHHEAGLFPHGRYDDARGGGGDAPRRGPPRGRPPRPPRR